ncbi:MAG: O-antigen ligase family protein [Fimbriimonas sp.]
MKENRLVLGLLALAAFLVPWMGGQIAVGDPSIEPGSALSAIFFAGGAATLSHALLGLIAAIALGLMLRRRVVQVPRPALVIPLGLWGVFLIWSVGVSDFRFESLRTFVGFALYSVIFFATVAAVGRQAGPKTILVALFAGGFLCALIGLFEYAGMKSQDPNWRIFANWNNPNAAAAALLVSFIIGVGLTITSERVLALLSGFGTVLIGLALVLTGSKGGFALALPIAMACLGGGFLRLPNRSAVSGLLIGVTVVGSGFLFLKGFLWFAFPLGAVAYGIGVWAHAKPRDRSVQLVRPLAIFVALGAMIGLLQFQANQPVQTSDGQTVQHAAPLSRISNASQTQDQSSEFRLNLWRTTFFLIRQRPIGVGLSAFQFESGRASLATQTVLAHNSYLQMAAEASVLGLLTFLTFGVVWLVHVHRGALALPTERSVLRSTVVAAVVGLMIHSLVDSDLYYFGLGFILFLLLGLGLLLSGDAVAPESLPGGMRAVGGVFAGSLALVLLLMGVAEFQVGVARAYLQVQDVAKARSALDSAKGLAPNSPSVWATQALMARSQEEQLADLATASQLGPSTKNLRNLADAQSGSGQYVAAIGSLSAALRRDPANLPAFTRLLKLHRDIGDEAAATEVARRMVAVESTPAFRIRSIPESVPTETYEARFYLASKLSNLDEKIATLRPAIDGFLQYAQTTAPTVWRSGKGGQPGYDSPEKAKLKLETAAAQAKILAGLYLQANQAAEAKAAEEASITLAAEAEKAPKE